MSGLKRCRWFIVFLSLCWALNAQAVGNINVNPLNTDAGTVGLNLTLSETISVVISNSGNSDLTLFSITSNNPEFVVTQPVTFPVVLAPGGAVFVSVDFTPVTAGARQATLTVTSDDPNNNTSIVTITGYGGIEQSITLLPNDFSLELGHGKSVRAEVVFDNGEIGPALLDWQSSDTGVVSANAGVPDKNFLMIVSTGDVESLAVGNANVTVTSVNDPGVIASMGVQVVNPGQSEFAVTVDEDRIWLIKDGVASFCYDFPESDVNSLPLYSVNQVAVATDSTGQIGDLYVTANASNGSGEEVFYIQGCLSRSAVYSPIQNEVFADMVVDSTGKVILSEISAGKIIMGPSSIGDPVIILPPGPDRYDVGALSLDSGDNIFVAGIFETATNRYAAVNHYNMSGAGFTPVAVVENTVTASSISLPAIGFEGYPYYIHIMKRVSPDKTVIERYVDLDHDGNYFNLVGSTVVADVGEVIEVAQVTAGMDLHQANNDELYVSVLEAGGRSVMRFTDRNGDGDFDDAQERTVVFQADSNFVIKDVAFPTPCRLSEPPISAIHTLPTRGAFELGEEIILLGGSSSDPCNEALTYKWDLDGDGGFETSGATVSVSFTGLPDIHQVCLLATDASGNSDASCRNLKVGPPRIYAVWPASAEPGEFAFIFGRNFRTASGGLASVCFDTTICTPIVQAIGSDLLIAVIPFGAANTSVTVTTEIGSHTWIPINVQGLAIHAVWPGQASVNDVVFVFGQDYDTAPGGMSVTLNGSTVFGVQPVSSDLFLFLVPAGSTSGPVCVTSGTETACSAGDLSIVP